MTTIITAIESSISEEPKKESKKRKRNAEASQELEVNINAPEPPSKKALRRAKKGKLPTTTSTATTTVSAPDATQDGDETVSTRKGPRNPTEQETSGKRSEHGIWVGNLPFTVTKADLRTFFTEKTQIAEPTITRIHIPPPTDAASSRQMSKPQNKGFAYVDFSSPEAVTEALALSETLLMGRKVLIKDAHDFKGRPEKADTENAANAKSSSSGKPPNKRIFVGNLTFDTEKSDLEEHFGQCGEVENVHVATFEDSGKCKGYAWVTFVGIEAAEAAVRGYVMKKPEEEEVEEDLDDPPENEDGDEEPVPSTEKSKKKKKQKPKDRKWWVNKLKGRPLRMEFAEDATVRYKKRFGKDAAARGAAVEEEAEEEKGAGSAKDAAPAAVDARDPTKPSLRPRNPDRAPRPPKKVDARNIKPGAALAAAPRRPTGGIIAGQGKKTTF
ncbi:MAG: hypothetical protein Q9182_004759 [Xanthomendoza sp. 2 TL-2023]